MGFGPWAGGEAPQWWPLQLSNTPKDHSSSEWVHVTLADMDECQNSSACGAHSICHNLLGSFQCICDQGYESARDGRHCLGMWLAAEHGTEALEQTKGRRRGGGLDPSGTFFHPFLTDVNECETLHGVCGTAPCENVEGSFLCICPQAGEEFDPMTGRCIALPGAGESWGGLGKGGEAYGTEAR